MALSQKVVDVRAEKKIRVAINGFGRIGRNFLRCWEGRSDSLLDVVAINDSGGVKQASHLLKYDSTLGKFNAEVKVVDDSTLQVNGKNIKVVSSRDPTQLPWKELEIDLVIEGTGVFLDTPGAGKHIQVRVAAGGAVLVGLLGTAAIWAGMTKGRHGRMGPAPRRC
ncbi:hypothetical protein MNEG_11860 [Monoraphidium neglectum]|uniref:Glyceraldehyde 3-phosphate dehydrogenase NAD(P) binding domain-containing protein n=1 Tax=Monoraphidium neglectum TaxID=145388 RepID=A0A0D2LXF2_9CHLO|nr:hypothetical protein MNEG_11860 [Monoraphidium neglectum]KIY96104.1 hypothetical protein MNEG_11860 [Monoraphidium neglectum]|eukprot:XP_013895124.1 hypothetical protein MNEG_11860 [Monoraphidium neglectum]